MSKKWSMMSPLRLLDVFSSLKTSKSQKYTIFFQKISSKSHCAGKNERGPVFAKHFVPAKNQKGIKMKSLWLKKFLKKSHSAEKF